MYCEVSGKYSALLRLLRFCFVPRKGQQCKIQKFEPLKLATEAYYLIYNNQDSTPLLKQLPVDGTKHPFLFKFCEILKQEFDNGNKCFLETGRHFLLLFPSEDEELILSAPIASMRLAVLEPYLDDVITSAFALTDSALKELGLVDVACDPELGQKIAYESIDAIIDWAGKYGMECGDISLEVFAAFVKLAINC